MSNNIPQKPYKPLTPFGIFVKHNFPFIEATYEARDNYDLLCKVYQQLKTVEYNQGIAQENIEALYNFLNTLDLQDEVNNKLDEMAESGQLENILLEFLSAQKIYSTFSDVLSDSSNLVVGQKIKTFGYNNINDGGNGEYIIENSKNSSDFYIDIATNLYARLVLKNNEVNINALGADKTGQTNVSSLLNNTIGIINTRWLNNNFDVNTIILNGTYLIENQITLTPFVKLRGSGYVIILTNLNGSAIKINYIENVSNPSNFAGDKLDWLYSELINFDKGCLIKNINGENLGTCIEIGNPTDWGSSKAISRYTLKNFRIQNYNIGILHNRYHNYIGKFENISFENNIIGVQYGINAGDTVLDSGENMTYINCLFSSKQNAVKWLTDGFDSSFEMCSFDFLVDIFYDASNKGYKRISCNQCHFEGYTGCIMNTLSNYSMLTITNSSIVDSGNVRNGNNAHTIPFKNISSPIVLENNKYIPVSVSTNDPTHLFFNIGQRIKMSNYTGVANTWIGFLGANNIAGSIFDNITAGTYTNDTGHEDSQFNGWKFEYGADKISNQFTIVQDDYIYEGHKSLVVKSADGTTANKNIIMTTDYIDVSNFSYLRFNDFTYNMKINSSSYTVKMYDVNKNQIDSKSLTHTSSPANPKTSNTWYCSSVGVNCFIPTECKYIKVTVGYGNINNSTADPIGTEYKIGGLVINGL